MSGYKKHFIDIAFRNAPAIATTKFIYGTDLYNGDGYDIMVKHISFEPADTKSDTTTVTYMHGDLNYYEWFENYLSTSKWLQQYEVTIECKIEYDNRVRERYNEIANDLHGQKKYWHIVWHYLNDLNRVVDNNGSWLYGQIEVGDLKTGDTAWEFTIKIKGDMELITPTEEEVDE